MGRYVGKALKVGSGFGKGNGTSFSVIAARHPRSYSSWLPSGLGYPRLLPKGTLRFPCLQHEVHDLGISPPIGEVPASELALGKLNDRNVMLGARKDHETSSSHKISRLLLGAGFQKRL
jgi:hypothetical protein